MKIIPLSEGAFTIDKTKQFIPFDLIRDELQQRSTGSLLVEIQPFVIITTNDVLLLDTGLGFTNNDGVLQIHQNLADNNIKADDITKVLMSHLHKDHSGGLKGSFPNATYYINKHEFSHALEPGNPSYLATDLSILSKSANVELTEGNGVIDDFIHYEVTGAHSLYHQVFWIMDGKQRIFFGGDDAPQLQQMKNRFVAKYDYDGKKCMELRKQWWQQGQNEGWTFLFYHDIKSPVYSFQQAGD